jgi:hypothetical protein
LIDFQCPIAVTPNPGSTSTVTPNLGWAINAQNEPIPRAMAAMQQIRALITDQLARE